MWTRVWTLVAMATALALGQAEEFPSQLRRLVTLSRHGSRAPNDIVERICPNNLKNLEAYNVPLEQLTEFGMQQLVAVGEHIRKVYVEEKKFLSSTFNGVKHAHFETYFRSDAATRCSQSATAVGYGLYPDGTGPKGFPRQPVPVTMQLLQNEHDFAAPKGPCKKTFVADMVKYADTRAKELMTQYNDSLVKMSEICGVNVFDVPKMQGGEDLVLAVKDIADMFIFDRDEQLPPLDGLTPELSEQLEQLAFTNLMERYYTTDRMITYWNGGFSDLLLGKLNEAAMPDSPSPKEYRYFSYHGHRELLHGLAKMIGWDFSFEGLPTALNTSALHPGTTMFFELHARANTSATNDESYFLKTFMWDPTTKQREQVTLSKCSSADCPLNEFNNIIKSHIARTGTWQSICNYKDETSVSPLKQFPPSIDEDDVSSGPSGYVIVICTLVGLGLAFVVVKAVLRMRNHRRQGYETL
ncbi:hypothetical protein Poli38472_006277 [Pythium oligandrum]|uniref:Acid phosphatase n=1 Tax=Pythium oligandrum TaxID=41045 RepID=A0A8K1CT79_PYTOL|nr:hypothetical protein Poli38472_006277 [Pythium oligandrum]|eukprot:TMW68809.1 hypothetical protein Poli38472_006277 [Pythium oligandrum]